jgi:hypothetical protein
MHGPRRVTKPSPSPEPYTRRGQTPWNEFLPHGRRSRNVVPQFEPVDAVVRYEIERGAPWHKASESAVARRRADLERPFRSPVALPTPRCQTATERTRPD